MVTEGFPANRDACPNAGKMFLWGVMFRAPTFGIKGFWNGAGGLPRPGPNCKAGMAP